MMEALWNVIIDFADWLLGLVKDVFLAVWDFLIDGVAYLLDIVLGWMVGLVEALDVSAVQGAGSAWSSLPADVTNVIGLLGLGNCMVIIGAAILIRLTLQLIPFVRLGS